MHVQDPSQSCSPERAIALGACSLQPPGVLGLLHLLHQPVSQICLHVQGPCRACSPEERLRWECAVCNLQGFCACCICGISLHICSSRVPAKPGPDSQWSGQCTGKPAPQPAQAECQHAECLLHPQMRQELLTSAACRMLPCTVQFSRTERCCNSEVVLTARLHWPLACLQTLSIYFSVATSISLQGFTLPMSL